LSPSCTDKRLLYCACSPVGSSILAFPCPKRRFHGNKEVNSAVNTAKWVYGTMFSSLLCNLLDIAIIKHPSCPPPSPCSVIMQQSQNGRRRLNQFYHIGAVEKGDLRLQELWRNLADFAESVLAGVSAKESGVSTMTGLQCIIKALRNVEESILILVLFIDTAHKRGGGW